MSSDLEILRIVVVRSHGQQQPPVSGVLDTIWAHSHGRRQPPVSWELDTCCGTFTQSEMIACMSWDLGAVLWCVRTVRDYNLRVLGRGHCCGVFTRAEVYRVHRRVKEDESVKVACEENAAGSASFSFLLLLFATSWVLRLLTSFSTRSLATHKRWWRRGRRKSIGLDPIFWGVFGGYTQPEIDDIAEVGSGGTQASSIFGNLCCWVSVSVSCLCLCRNTVVEMQRVEIQSWRGKE